MASNPLDEYLSTKTAANWGSNFLEGAGKAVGGEALGHQLATAGIIAGGSAAIGAAGFGMKALYNAATKSRDFKNMLAFNADLVPIHKEDPKFFNQAFTTLRGISPEFSRDPLIAGNYMRQMTDRKITAGGIAEEAISSAVNLQRLHAPGEHAQVARQGMLDVGKEYRSIENRRDEQMGLMSHQHQLEDKKHQYVVQREQSKNSGGK